MSPTTVPQKDKKALPPLPEEANSKYGYVAIFNDKEIEIQDATSLNDAKQKAIKRLNVPVSKQGLLSVMPAEKDGNPITHTPSMEEGRQQQSSKEKNEINLLKNALRKKAFFRNFITQSQEFITGFPVPGGEDASDAVSPSNIIMGAIDDELSGDMSIYEEN